MRNPSLVRSTILAACLAAGPAAHPQTIDVPGPPRALVDSLAAWRHQPPGPELSARELALDPGAGTRRSISRAAAATDVERFFHLLEHGWCGYGYFSRGHDFAAARARILAELDARRSWPTRELAPLVRRHLGFVTDGHLKLGDVTFAGHQDFWFAPDLQVTARDGRFHLGDGQDGPLIVAVNHRSPAEFVFRSLDPGGLPTRVLGTLSVGEPLPLRVALDAGGVTTERPCRLTRSVRRRSDLFRSFRLGGIPVVRIGTFSDHHVKETAEFLETADALRGEPCVVVDLRGNGGGNTRWPKEWIRRFTGRTPAMHQVLTELVSRTTLTGQANYLAWLAAGPGRAIGDRLAQEQDQLAVRRDSFDAGGARPYWQAPAIPARPAIPNDATLVVVIDAAIASAGEGFLSYLHDQVENVVLVGENTRGAVTFGHLSVHRLPNSGLLAFLPVKLNAPLDLVMREERGFDPDWWVPAEDALNRAVAAIRAGTIRTARPLPAAVLAGEFVPESPPRFDRRQRRVLRTVAAVTVSVLLGALIRRRTRKA